MESVCFTAAFQGVISSIQLRRPANGPSPYSPAPRPLRQLSPRKRLCGPLWLAFMCASELAQATTTVAMEDCAAARASLQALSEEDRWLAERLLLEDETECKVAKDLGVSQATVSRRKRSLLRTSAAPASRNGKRKALRFRAQKPRPHHYR